MTPVHYLPVDALVPHGTGALASLPPQAERSLVLVVGVGAAQRAEGAIASQKSELNFNLLQFILMTLKTFDTCQYPSWQSWRMEAEPWQSG